MVTEAGTATGSGREEGGRSWTGGRVKAGGRVKVGGLVGGGEGDEERGQLPDHRRRRPLCTQPRRRRHRRHP